MQFRFSLLDQQAGSGRMFVPMLNSKAPILTKWLHII
jgi:hypothetical protein